MNTGTGRFTAHCIRATSITPTSPWSGASSKASLPEVRRNAAPPPRSRVGRVPRAEIPEAAAEGAYYVRQRGPMLTDGSHARLVHSVTRDTSRNASAPEHVKRSWLRCLDEYGLDPESSGEPAVLSQ